jgi:hypothetical protein
VKSKRDAVGWLSNYLHISIKESKMRSTLNVLWGLLLVFAGALFLLDNLGLIEVRGAIWGVMIGVGGFAFLSVYLADREHWWAIIPGMTLLGVAALILMGSYFPRMTDRWGGSFVMGSIGLAFLIIYLAKREFWWALIPAGVMGTLAAVIGLSDILPGIETGGIFFLGLGLTFAVVALIPNPQGSMKWAYIPAGILGGIGLLILIAWTAVINYLWALGLIAVGLFLLLRAIRPARG